MPFGHDAAPVELDAVMPRIGAHPKLADDATVDADGWYTTILRRLGPKIDGLVRYDIFDPDKDSNGDVTKTLTVGVNWNLNKGGYSRCQLNYERKREEGAQVSNDLLLAQFQAGF